MTIDTSYEDIRYEVLRDCREKLAEMMLRCSIATGHGDTFDDLLRELEASMTPGIEALRDAVIAAARRVLSQYQPHEIVDAEEELRVALHALDTAERENES